MAPQGPECCGLPFSLHSVPPPLDLTLSLVKIGDQCFAGGGFGDVYKCQYLDGLVSREVAVKALRFKSAIDGDTGDSSVKMLRRELGIWRRLHHNNVVPFLGVAYGFGIRNTLSLVSSWMPNGTLNKFVAMHGDKLDVGHRLKILLDVANGLHYLHSLPIVHGDLNTNNVLLDADYTARLADFGYASLVGNVPEVLTYLQRSTVRPGALRWTAPEQIDPEGAIARTIESDIYSFGCIAFQESSRQTNVFWGKQPWSEVREDASIVLRLYRGDKPGRPESQTMDDVHWHFIQRCWSPLYERPATDSIILLLRQFLSDHPPSVHLCDLLISSPSQADPGTNHELEGVDADSSFQMLASCQFLSESSPRSIPAVAPSPLRLTAPTNGPPSILPQPHSSLPLPMTESTYLPAPLEGFDHSTQFSITPPMSLRGNSSVVPSPCDSDVVIEHPSVHVGEGSTIQAESSPFPTCQQTVPESNYTNMKTTRDTKNVIIFGGSGVGKSSLINLLAGETISETSSSALGRTLNYKRHLLDMDNQLLAIWDTAGLDEGTAEKAEVYLRQLLSELAKSNGVNLLVYCVRGTRIRSALLTNYHLFYSAICRRKVPIAIVITGLENQEGNMETWWYNNEPQFTLLKMSFDGHACVTTLAESSSENANLVERREVSKAAVTRMIISTCRTERWKPTERNWVETAYADIRAMLSPKDNPSTHLPTLIVCEAYRKCRDGRLSGRGKRAMSFQNPIFISLSLSPLSFRSPISFSNDMSWSKLPFDCGIRCTPERLYHVYQALLEGGEEETKRVTVIKRAADLLIFCIKMEETKSGTIKSQWENFNITYSGDLSPQIIVVVGAPDQPSAERWWKGAVGESFAKNDVCVAYWPPESAAAGAKVEEAARRQLQSLIHDRCIDYSKVTFTRKEELFRRTLRMDMSGLASKLWLKSERISGESEPPEQDVLTELGVWQEYPTLTSPKKPKMYF